MKNIILVLISIFLISCSTQKVLKTDTREEIDLSGRWNNTDAEIATSELSNNLNSSVWLKKYQSSNNLKPRIEILEFEDNFKGGGEKVEKFFIQYINSNPSFEIVESGSEKVSEFMLSGKINAEEFVTEEDNYIDYTLFAKLKNLKGEILWEHKTTIKKYIKQ